MRAYVFDLDDTLYDEMTYVHSGFRAVSSYLADTENIDAIECETRMRASLIAYGRGQVFDDVLASYGLLTRKSVNACLSVYRGHVPEIELSPDARACLKRLYDAGKPVYIVTDGNKLVQLAKLRALGLYESPLIRRSYISRRYGLHNEKPSPYCFHKITLLEQASPADIVYIGDNPAKDFVGIKPLGFRTVRILRGSHREVLKPYAYEADFTIDTLDGLEQRLEAFVTGQERGIRS
ncbi:HAD family hydrolase [Cohnella ginsengisoli]|uniref:HAD family hydrolase n=1 Tax=Cohnella ginsengisoli TaxID=425004 RepID=A0A9X4QQH5_9BACL|nr:HAD family hydrolase [Cohnella ginsengisoli]MDG0794586.1 HAD family hydrolase [Cohnella ginsengisoli]